MESIRHKALSELARVTAKDCFMLEPFAERNSCGWPYRYVRARGYFEGAVQELSRFGLEPQWLYEDYPQEIHLKTCGVLASKTGPAT